MKKENEKLLSTAAAKDEENKALKIKLETAVTTAKKCETEIKSVRAKLSEETARSLTLEEENKKLKLNNDKVLQEKATILGKMINTTGLSDTIETKIETEMQDLKDWSRGQMEICGLFWEFVAPPGKRNLVAIMAQRHVLGT